MDLWLNYVAPPAKGAVYPASQNLSEALTLVKRYGSRRARDDCKRCIEHIVFVMGMLASPDEVQTILSTRLPQELIEHILGMVLVMDDVEIAWAMHYTLFSPMPAFSADLMYFESLEFSSNPSAVFRWSMDVWDEYFHVALDEFLEEYNHENFQTVNYLDYVAYAIRRSYIEIPLTRVTAIFGHQDRNIIEEVRSAVIDTFDLN